MSGIEILDDDTFLGAENSFNLFTCQKDRYDLRSCVSSWNRKRIFKYYLIKMSEEIIDTKHLYKVSVYFLPALPRQTRKDRDCRK